MKNINGKTIAIALVVILVGGYGFKWCSAKMNCVEQQNTLGRINMDACMSHYMNR